MFVANNIRWENKTKRISSFEPVQLLLALAEYAHVVAEQSAVCTTFSLLPADLSALLWSVGFFSGAVFFAWMTLARSAFHGFQIGVKRCKSASKTHV